MEINGIGHGGLTSRNNGQETYEVIGVEELKVDNNLGFNGSNEEEVKEAVKELNKLFDKNTYAEYEVREGIGNIIIRIIDGNTKEVIKEIPPEKIIEMVEAMCERAGIMINKKA
ncbi:flagellar protein FlaG [Clostridium cellulovorans]|uniref:Flagellar protein FlaG protein n=1 Tax=Clostridium cellulovorans (strain ATCC 35296 / DSM 3052 / OCM 3 / 743B) TaxID=573061 RepID=D9SKF3_CLOC7|nr:flagellar protein FlaG [Clostridium cellulovorans]ADL51449.1 flagellar protein FlaG protein [Clostridium cellulovorans 743B]